MLIELKRTLKLPKCTLGDMYVDGKFVCYVVEDTVREVVGTPVASWKIPHVTAIPVGTYEVIIDMSNRFKKLLPLIKNVSGFEGVRIHSGNTAEDTEGCLIVGNIKMVAGVGQSKVAMAKLQPMIQAALDRKEKVQLTIS